MIQQREHPLADLLPAFAGGSLDPAQTTYVEAHLADCEECRAALDDWQSIRQAVQAGAAQTPTASRGLLDRAFAKIDEEARRPSWRERVWPQSQSSLLRRSLASVTAAAVLTCALAFTPVGSYAQGVFEALRPQQFAIVPVRISDLEALPELDQYGVFSQVSGGTPQVHQSAAQAGAAAGMTILVPSYLPSSVSASPSYLTVPRHSATFTFSAVRAQAAAQALGQSLPAMPAQIDGSSVQMTTGNGVVTVYGNHPFQSEVPQAQGEVVSTEKPASLLAGLGDMIPQLVIAKTEAPVAIIAGTSAEELREYLLDLPGISDELADAVRAIGDPTQTWPVPMPVGEVKTRPVTVQGVRGTAFTDLSNFGAGVLWLKDGFVHAVAAPLSEDEVLKIAESLR